MARVSPLMVLPPAIFAGLAAMFLWGMQRENPEALPTALAGRPAPPVVLAELDGPVFTDADLRDGKPKLVNYWASWCGPCRVEHPQLTAIEVEGIPIYGVNYKDSPAKALAFLEELGNPYVAMGADEAGRMALDWGVYGVPETYVLDGAGNIVHRFAGPITERVMETDIRPALERAAAAGG